MPAMPRPRGMATKIAYSIMGTPPNMPYEKHEIKRSRKVGSTPSNPYKNNNVRFNDTSLYNDTYDDLKEPVSHGVMGGGYL